MKENKGSAIYSVGDFDFFELRKYIRVVLQQTILESDETKILQTEFRQCTLKDFE